MRRTLQVAIHLHVPREEPDAERHVLDGDAGPWEYDGIASDGRPCVALSVSQKKPCPKWSAVILLTEDTHHVAVCGSHFGVHRSGRMLVLTDR